MSRDGFIRINEVADLYGVSRRTIYRWIDQQKLPPLYELGNNSVAFKEAEINHWGKSRPLRTKQRQKILSHNNSQPNAA